jgi:hypothetical protein
MFITLEIFFTSISKWSLLKQIFYLVCNLQILIILNFLENIYHQVYQLKALRHKVIQ